MVMEIACATDGALHIRREEAPAPAGEDAAPDDLVPGPRA